MPRGFWILASCVFVVACGNKAPSRPAGSTDAVSINGNERLGWDQQAANAGELNDIRYAIYVDGARSELDSATCQPARTSAGFPCSAPVPKMPNGTHTLELAAYVFDGTSVLESPRSPALRVILGTALTSPAAAAAVASQMATADGLTLVVEPVATDVNEPTDLAFTPDGRLLVADARGAVHLYAGSQLREPAALQVDGPVLALAVDPSFDDSQFVYALQASTERANANAFTVSRFRLVDNVLTERIVLFDQVQAGSDPHGTLRFGEDHRLYIAYDDAGEPDRTGDLASENGKILRFERDGTTPPDQAGLTPLFAFGLHSPRGVAFQAATHATWAADESAGQGLLYTMRSPGPKIRAEIQNAFRLPPTTTPSAMAFYHGSLLQKFDGNLFVTSAEGEHVLRIVFDAANPGTVQSTELLLRNRIGPITAIAESPDQTIYLAASTALWRIRPAN